MNRWLKRGIVVAAIAAIGAGLRFTVFREQPVPVTVYRVAAGRVEETVTNSKAGTVKARRRAKISPEIGGRVATIGARPGDRVRKGQVLLRLGDSDLKAQLALARQELATARATAREACLTAEQAQRDYRRNLDLKKDAIVSEEILERMLNQSEGAAARCEAARAAIERSSSAIDLAQANLEKSVLRAPFDGIVADLDAELGEWVSPSPPAVPIPPVYDVIDPSSIYVSAPLDEVDAATVTPGLPARVTLDPYPQKSFEGRVARVAPYVQDIEQQNRTLEIEVDFTDPEITRAMLPGTSADIEIILDARDGVLRIPAYALLEGARVLVFGEGRLKARQVKTGLRNWEYAEVTEGLTAGEPVVVSLDREEVRDGAKAAIREEIDGAVDGARPGSGSDSSR
ncbi:MAG: efflux RND transporter periplasmic adaptor subunit [Candidatus Polarisedimenticolia bacterium]